MTETGKRRSLFIPAVVSFGAFAFLCGLGLWQIERKAWKEALIDTLEQRLHSAPVALPTPDAWPLLTPDTAEFMRVKLRVQFLPTGDALVYTSGSAIRDDVKGQGYFVFSAAALPNGQRVVVNRGFTAGRPYPQGEGTHDIVGVLRWPEAPSMLVPEKDSAGDIWFVRDHLAMAQARGWGPVAPFYVEQEGPVPAGGVPHPSPLKVRLRNDHLQYAITWFGLAAVWAIMFIVWVRRQRRGTAADGGPAGL